MLAPDNVIRFPAERRRPQTLELLLDLAPDAREVVCVAAQFGLEPPEPDIARLADVEMAETILNHASDKYSRHHTVFLDQLLRSVLDKAVCVCREVLNAQAAALRVVERHTLRSARAPQRPCPVRGSTGCCQGHPACRGGDTLVAACSARRDLLHPGPCCGTGTGDRPLIPARPAISHGLTR